MNFVVIINSHFFNNHGLISHLIDVSNAYAKENVHITSAVVPRASQVAAQACLGSHREADRMRGVVWLTPGYPIGFSPQQAGY